MLTNHAKPQTLVFVTQGLCYLISVAEVCDVLTFQTKAVATVVKRFHRAPTVSYLHISLPEETDHGNWSLSRSRTVM